MTEWRYPAGVRRHPLPAEARMADAQSPSKPSRSRSGRPRPAPKQGEADRSSIAKKAWASRKEKAALAKASRKRYLKRQNDQLDAERARETLVEGQAVRPAPPL